MAQVGPDQNHDGQHQGQDGRRGSQPDAHQVQTDQQHRSGQDQHIGEHLQVQEVKATDGHQQQGRHQGDHPAGGEHHRKPPQQQIGHATKDHHQQGLGTLGRPEQRGQMMGGVEATALGVTPVQAQVNAHPGEQEQHGSPQRQQQQAEQAPHHNASRPGLPPGREERRCGTEAEPPEARGSGSGGSAPRGSSTRAMAVSGQLGMHCSQTRQRAVSKCSRC